jgi:ribosomal protein S18 acetylase RimI-like enzyme
MVEIKIRKATRADIPTLIDFQQKLAIETEGVVLNPAIVQQGMTAMFDDPSKGFYNVAVSENEIAGCHMVTFEWSDWRNGWAYWLQSVYVREDYRKYGVFRKMYESLKITVENDLGIVGLRLYVDKSNQRAQKVYQAMGMNGDHYTVFEWMKP